MTTATVVYASRSGNTRTVAEAIAAGLRERVPTTVLEADEVTTLPEGVDLLVVGGPTEGHGMTPALARLLDRLVSPALEGMAVAAFDTRLHVARWLSGSAAAAVAETLGVSGGRPVAAPESFFVHGREPALGDGEAQRAASWGRSLAEAVTGAATAPR